MALLAAATAGAKVALPPFFSDNMVLQHSSDVKLWGAGRAGATLTVKASWADEAVKTKIGPDGRWETVLHTPGPGGPYWIELSDGKKTRLENVLCGEVWLCSGQSNMEMKMRDGVLCGQTEIDSAASRTGIRLLQVQRTLGIKPTDDIVLNTGGWETSSAESVQGFSAAAWFFARKLNSELGIPVGLIESSWGGSIIEAWMPREELAPIGRYTSVLEQLAALPDDPGRRSELFEQNMQQWISDMAGVDYAYSGGRLTWGLSGEDVSGWTAASVPGYLQWQGIEGMHGYFWMRKDVEIPPDWAGCDLTLCLGMVDDNDCTFFNGEYIGHTEVCIKPRVYTIDGKLVHGGTNTIALRVMDTGGLSGITGDAASLRLKKSEDEFIGLAGDGWWCRETVPMEQTPAFPLDLEGNQNTPTAMYNAMIYPLRDYHIRGVIWYQGESNSSDASHYKSFLPAMIRSWRNLWGYEFPFYYCQIANYMAHKDQPVRSEWAELREAQLQTLSVENTGMAVLIDIGEAGDIHPKNKAEVGRRLALNALKYTYGKDLTPCGPVYDGYTIGNGFIKIHFRHTEGGLCTAGGDPPAGFYIAGCDRVLHKAQATISDDGCVIVSCPDVPNPVAVRYAWADNPVCNLTNGAGLPASPFRTDDWNQ